jgi:hypothetical protein
MLFTITETKRYQVEANSAEKAEEIFLRPGPEKFFVAVKAISILDPEGKGLFYDEIEPKSK